MKIVIYPDVDIWNYVLSGIASREDVRLIPLNKYCNLIQIALRKISIFEGFSGWMFLGSQLRRILSDLTAGDTVILCEYTNVSVISAITQLVHSHVACHLWLWNHQHDETSFTQRLNLIHQKGIQVTTFDEQNAKSFNLNWHSQFFPIYRVRAFFPNDRVTKTDFFFAGYSKNRRDVIDNINSLLSPFRRLFITVDNLKEYIPYLQYLQLASQSRCIVEIVHPGDPACTLRPLEALALNCKLFTNNPHIRHYSFYHPNNIFIYGKDDLALLSDFLESPIFPVSNDIVSSYDVNSWVDSFR